MASKQHRTVLLEVHLIGNKWQSSIRARLWTIWFKPSRTHKGSIVAANNFIRTHGLSPANRNRVSKNMYNVKRGII